MGRYGYSDIFGNPVETIYTLIVTVVMMSSEVLESELMD